MLVRVIWWIVLFTDKETIHEVTRNNTKQKYLSCHKSVTGVKIDLNERLAVHKRVTADP